MILNNRLSTNRINQFSNCKFNLKGMEAEHGKLKIIYLNNPDKVYYNELDDVIVKNLNMIGLEVELVNLENINFEVSQGKIKLFIKNIETKVDGFMAYGWMSPLHYKAYIYIVNTFQSMGVVCLHSSEVEKIITDKYLQSLCFTKKNVPFPSIFQGYSVSAYKDIANRVFPEKQFSIFKLLDDYGGDGIIRCETKELLVSTASKALWKDEYCIFQKYIPDSVGRSIRVLCIDSKAIAIAEYNDKTGSFLSNVSYGEFFKLESLMNHEKLKEYIELGEKAAKSIGEMTICGVDILDSKSEGLVVLECNGFPDIFDISKSTQINVIEEFVKAFKAKVLKKNGIIS